MTKSKYLRLKKLIEKIEAQAEMQGIDISSADFESLVKQALNNRGVSLEEFQEAEGDYEDYEDGVDFSILTETQKKALEKRITEEVSKVISKVESLVIPTEEQIRKIAEDIAKKHVVEPKTINKIVQKIVKEKPVIQKEIIRDPDNSEVEKLKADLQYLLSEFSLHSFDSEKKIKEIEGKIPSDYIRESVLEPSIKELVAPELNRVVRSLQSQIYKNSQDIKGAGSNVTAQTPTGTINSSNKDFTHTGTLVALFLNGIFQIPTTHYTTSGNTITYVTAPSTGMEHVALVQ